MQQELQQLPVGERGPHTQRHSVCEGVHGEAAVGGEEDEGAQDGGERGGDVAAGPKPNKAGKGQEVDLNSLKKETSRYCYSFSINSTRITKQMRGESPIYLSQ